MEEVKEVFRVMEDDLRHASFGYPADNPNVNLGICRFVIDDNCSVGNENFCKNNTDRFFISDGWKTIRDNTIDNCPDGTISNTNYEALAGNEYYANITSYTSGAKSITVDTLNIDSKCRQLKSTTVICGANNTTTCNDITSKTSVIICGCSNPAANISQEGRRINNISSNTINFLSTESALNFNNCANGIVLPAISWYIRKKNNIYWLYRNQKKVIPNVNNLQIVAGYDSNNDGIVDNTEEITVLPVNAKPEYLKYFQFNIDVGYQWRNKEYYFDYSFKVEVRP